MGINRKGGQFILLLVWYLNLQSSENKDNLYIIYNILHIIIMQIQVKQWRVT